MNTMLLHLQINEENRNQDWDEKFFKLFSESKLQILADDPQQGPDGWPYLICNIISETRSDPTSEIITDVERLNDKVDSAQKILHWLSTRGIGLVVNPKRLPYPDYVFSYGMIWSFRETGYFIRYQNLNIENKFVINQNSDIKVGPPSAEYFPQYVRNIIKDFLRDQSVFDARILMISTDGENYDLCFSLESLGSPPEAEHEGILEAISWFLPPHYSIAVVSEKGLNGFESL